MTGEEINFTVAVSLCVIGFLVWFSVVGCDILSYLFRNKCKNCTHCKDRICDIGEHPTENLNIEGHCGFYKKR